MTNNHLLSVNDLNIGFQNNNQVINTIRDVNIYIDKGESVAIVGESGSGKTVTCRSMLGLVPSPPAVYLKGQIIFDEVDLLQLKENDWRDYRGSRISMVFQDPMTALNPVYTIQEQLENVYIYQGKKSMRSKLDKPIRVLRKEAYERSIELLEKMQLPEPKKMLGRYPHELSGGQRQRIIIALALVHRPELLICDEPGTALDVTVQASINEELTRLVKDEGISMFYITHNLGVAKNVSDRIYVMQLGEVVEEGNTDDVFFNPQSDYTKALINALPRIIDSKVV